MVANDQAPWGRVDETGTVFVREADGERAVGQFPDAPAEEALAYFERKFVDLAGQVTLLEQRIKRGTAPTDVGKTVASLKAAVRGAHAVGDLSSLLARLDALDSQAGELSEKLSLEARAALEEAVAARTALVVEAEALAAADPAKAQWKQVSASLDDLFSRWQKQQQEGPRLPKAESNELWKRFRTARSIIEQHRKTFFAELDSAHKGARAEKQALVEKAEALLGNGAEGISAYRQLLEEWKKAPRAGKKFDDALWEKFKAAGDALYAVKAQGDAKENEEYSANLAAKLDLLSEAEALLTVTDRDAAKKTLAAIQQRWDQLGKVPRDKVKPIEDRLRKVEAAVRKLDEEHWQRTNPERKARSEGLATQLQDAIARLERDLAEAEAGGDAKRVAQAREALEARRLWLNAIGS
ncbi:MAG: DUF349 domain-containing protein [Microbacteriaceae bacterium]